MSTQKKRARKGVFDDMGIDEYCERIIAGESMTSIAKSLNASLSGVVKWIASDSDRSARAREARVTSAKTWDEKASQGVEDACDAFELAKAKELAYHYRWRSSKIAPRDYGDKIAIGGAEDLPAIKQDVNVTPEQAYMLAIEGKKADS